MTTRLAETRRWSLYNKITIIKPKFMCLPF